MENMRKRETSIPEKYGMISCLHCDSIGKFLTVAKEFIVCPSCGGFGAIKKPEGELFQPHRMMDHWSKIPLNYSGKGRGLRFV
jgi:hypothetical protein